MSTDMPTDTELILLRQRLATVEDAITDWMAAAQETGAARMRAYQEMMRHLARHADERRGLPDVVWHFLIVYDETLAPREAALAKLTEALTTDFRTALRCAVDLTPEQAAEWLGGGAQGGQVEEKEETRDG